MADINDLYPSQKEYADYFKGQHRRGNARSKSAISPIFTKARDKVTTDILEVLNDRRYLKITDQAKRLKAVKRDPKMNISKLSIHQTAKHFGEPMVNASHHSKE